MTITIFCNLDGIQTMSQQIKGDESSSSCNVCKNQSKFHCWGSLCHVGFGEAQGGEATRLIFGDQWWAYTIITFFATLAKGVCSLQTITVQAGATGEQPCIASASGGGETSVTVNGRCKVQTSANLIIHTSQPTWKHRRNNICPF